MEPWIDYIMRATEEAELKMGELNIEDWVMTQRRRKWRLAGHTARRVDGRWSTRLLDWRPEGGHRERKRPYERWAEDLNKFFAEAMEAAPGEWSLYAQHRDGWADFEDGFAGEIRTRARRKKGEA